MNFETEYKNLQFRIQLDRASISDAGLIMGDKFHRLGNQTISAIKKGELVAWNLIIVSHNGEEERTHYWSNILLTKNEEEILEELGQYLDMESILEDIVDNWKLDSAELGPAWRQTL